MYDRIRGVAGALASIALVLGVGACADTPTPTQQITPDDANAKNTTVKYTFEGATLVDGDLEVENAVIEATVRDHKNDWTNCSYFTESWATHLGEYGEGVVPGDGGADAVEAFCVDHFEDRQ